MNIFCRAAAKPGMLLPHALVLYVNYAQENGQELKINFDKWYKVMQGI